MNAIKKVLLIVPALVFVMTLAAPSAIAVSIDFNDGTTGVAIDAFYSGVGITFTEGSWGGPLAGAYRFSAWTSVSMGSRLTLCRHSAVRRVLEYAQQLRDGQCF